MRQNQIKNNCWENLNGFRYAHRGLFRQPRSASKKLPAKLTEGRGKKRPAGPDEVPGPLWTEDVSRWEKEGRRVIPENSMKAFRMAVRHGFGSELDVHLTADGKLAVFHDTNLLRMTGIDRRIEEMTWDELSQVRLLGTSHRIPLLEEVLDLYTSRKALTARRDERRKHTKRGTGKAGNAGGAGHTGAARNCRAEEDFLHLPLIIELKAEGNARALCCHVMEIIDRYPSLNYCIESFDPRVVYWLRRRRPDVIRGQLTENFMKSREAVRQWGYLMTFGMWSVAPDILSKPDFIACKYCDRRNIFIRFSHRMGVRQVNWIIRNMDELRTVEQEGGLTIFERFLPVE